MYDIIHLAPDEWGTDTMCAVASKHFGSHPDCRFVLVGGPRPERFSGVSERRA